jgi:phage terminase large subunit-like protein
VNLAELSPAELDALERLLEARKAQFKADDYFPDSGKFSRDKYPKHMAFFKAGKIHNERLFMAANRIGKTVCGAYESSKHLTGLYPHWWEGRTFAKATNGWAVGKTSETTRDIVQLALFGTPDKMGTGMVPADCIVDYRFKPNTNQSLDWVSVKHLSGQTSWVGFKSYDQGRTAFEGTEKDWIWLDEEPPIKIYTECLTRTATKNGIIFDTFTPLEGATEMVHSFLAPEIERI